MASYDPMDIEEDIEMCSPEDSRSGDASNDVIELSLRTVATASSYKPRI
jgi:hypothetical protein